MKINGIEYEITADIELGIMEDFDSNPSDTPSLKALLKAVMIPSPSEEDIRKFKQSDIVEILLAYYKAQSVLSIEFKKKLSLL